MNPNKSTDLNKLWRAHQWSRKKLEPFRKNTVDVVREFVGIYYADDGADKRVPMNFLELASSIYLQNLVSGPPQALITTPFKELKPSGADFELAINHLLKDIRLRHTLWEGTQNALFSALGICKVGMDHSGLAEVDGQLHEIGQPFAQVVDTDDWVHDVSAKRWDQLQFEGNRYRLPLEWVKESPHFKHTDDLQATLKTQINEEGDERADSISVGSETDPDEYQQFIELWDFFLPMEGLLITLPAENQGELKCLRTVEWDGPERGPYHKLYFNRVPGNLLPLSQAGLWRDMHDLANEIFRKCARQASRQKTITGVQAAGTADGKRVVEANDGDTVTMNDPNAVREYSYGGVDNTSLAFLLSIKGMFTYQAGNLDLLGGLSAQSPTATQDQLLSANASKRIQMMQQDVREYVQGIVEDLAFYLWEDPLIELPLTKRIEGTDIEIPTTWSAEQREGTFLHYNIKINPYSLQYESPEAKLNQMLAMLQTVILPALPMMQQQGVAIDWKMVLETISKYRNLPEMRDWFMYADNAMPQPGMQGQPPSKAPVTTRISERVGRAANTPAGTDRLIGNALLGKEMQPAEMAQLGAGG